MNSQRKVSIMDIINRRDKLLKCNLFAAIYNKGKGMEATKATKLIERVFKKSSKRYLKDIKKYSQKGFYEAFKKASIEY